MITIVSQQQDDENLNLWHFRIAGPDSVDGTIRLADLSEETTSPADWLAANQAEAQAAIDAGAVSEEYNEGVDFEALEEDIAGELAWITATLPEIDAGLAAVNGAFSNAGQRAIVTGLLQNQKRLLLQQRGEFKAWRYVIRQEGQ